MMMYFDWRLGLICLIPAAIAFALMGTLMMGPKMAADMKQYQNALETMSSEAVEYVRGIPVVKTFGQTVYTFKRFKGAIDEYEKWTLGYTKNMMLPMTLFTTAANGIFAAIIIAAFAFTGGGVTDVFVLRHHRTITGFAFFVSSLAIFSMIYETNHTVITPKTPTNSSLAARSFSVCFATLHTAG